ncbi:Fe(3+) ions import ATP-binding protein FbpC [Thiomonas sp. X19]|uniref:ABC transporter ATP-binding protein n=1 Tax=Thiomonas sp. X19 TaxID=1050370 RepID=UPI000B68F6D1|nr:ABC transporter ATP-binding protein [Thiomonas sp. X19]SCC91832.1 Fe(3+) ions import ATP-binding protein FbpC [Thiomonas sp. X19]
MTALRIRGLQADYGGQPVLRDIQFDLEPGDYACLLGRSGSGKSTLLAAVAGFVHPHAGQIAIDGETVCDPTQSIDRPPHQRGLGMVFQDANLWPHLDVMDNILFPLRARKLPADHRWAEELLDRVGLAGYGRRKPATLSGGQRQRVAICRALVAKPSLVLLDEPLSAVDGPTREELQSYLQTLFGETRTTALHVTHDPSEAFALGRHVAVLEQGRIVQWSTPATVYREPSSEVVAGLTGSFRSVPVNVDFLEQNDLARFTFDGRAWQAPAHSSLRTGPARLLLRPEAVRIHAQAGAWRVHKRRFEAGLFHVEVEHPNGDRIQGTSPHDLSQDAVSIDLVSEHCWLLPADNHPA